VDESGEARRGASDGIDFGDGDRAPGGGAVGGGGATAVAVRQAQLLLRGHPRRVIPAHPPLARYSLPPDPSC
jgi:hypothetical protein